MAVKNIVVAMTNDSDKVSDGPALLANDVSAAVIENICNPSAITANVGMRTNFLPLSKN